MTAPTKPKSPEAELALLRSAYATAMISLHRDDVSVCARIEAMETRIAQLEAVAW